MGKQNIRPLLSVVSALLLLGQFPVTAFGQSLPATSAPVSGSGELEGTASIKAIGPLHLSEGKVVLKDNEITIYSDATDSKEDAELVGAIIEAHTTGDGAARTITGAAVFTRGFSLPAIYNPKATESVLCSDEKERVGHIVDVTPKMLRIKTAQGVQAIPNKYITLIRSTRAYTFTVPLPAVPSSLNGPQPSASATAAPQTERKLISFFPTYTPEPSAVAQPSSVMALHAQLTKKHTGKTALKLTGLAAGVVACFAIPLGIAVACPPVSRYTHNNP